MSDIRKSVGIVLAILSLLSLILIALSLIKYHHAMWLLMWLPFLFLALGLLMAEDA